MLLDHTSGLKSYIPIYQQARSRARAIDILFAQPLLRPPGDSAVYSDLNALLLGLVIETGERLPHRSFRGPRGLRAPRHGADDVQAAEETEEADRPERSLARSAGGR